MAMKSLQENDKVEITVADDGIWFSFPLDPRTDRGLGMSLVQTLTEQIQGLLEVKSRNGSRFSLVFKQC